MESIFSKDVLPVHPVDTVIQNPNTVGLVGLSLVEIGRLVTALAATASPDIPQRRTNPDRRYSLKELAALGYGRGRFYKSYKHLIRKDGRKSYVLGRDLIALEENAPTLASSPPQPLLRRPRGRPRKAASVPAAAGGQDKQ